jgi:hypothetical protein
MAACHCNLWCQSLWSDSLCTWLSQRAAMAVHHYYLWWRRWWSDSICVQDSSHKVKIALHCTVPSNCCCGDFSASQWCIVGIEKEEAFASLSLLNCCKIGQMYFKADSRMCKLNLAVYLRFHLALSLAALHIWIRAHSITVSLCSVELRFAENLTEICLQFHNKRTRGEKNTTVFF